MSRSELINSALEVKNNCSEESETSDTSTKCACLNMNTCTNPVF